MFNLKKCSFTFLILLISLSSVFARGKKDATKEESHIIDTYQSEIKQSDSQEENNTIQEVPFTSEQTEILEVNEEPIIDDTINLESDDEVELLEEETEEIVEENPHAFDFSSENVMEITKKEYIYDFVPKKEQKLPKSIKIDTKKSILNPDECDKNGKTLLMKSIQSGDKEQIELLLESNANVNLQDKEGWSALMYCVRYSNDIELLEKLLECRADFQAKTNYGLSILDISVCYCENLDIIKRILSLQEINSQDVLKSFTLLLSSSFYDEVIFLKKIQLFLDSKINLNSLHNGKTPLMYLCQNNSSTKAIELLLQNGANKNIKSTENKTAFDYASENKSLQKADIYWSLN